MKYPVYPAYPRYAIHNGRRLFEPLHRRSQDVPELRIVFCVNIPRVLGSTEGQDNIVRRFAREFRSRHWPWDPPPELYYDRRSLETVSGERASLHAKCVIVDRRAALVTSANFTEAAHHRNIEAGVIVHYPPFADRLSCYFEALIHDGRLEKCDLSEPLV